MHLRRYFMKIKIEKNFASNTKLLYVRHIRKSQVTNEYGLPKITKLDQK
jgi:hypothetical protein